MQSRREPMYPIRTGLEPLCNTSFLLFHTLLFLLVISAKQKKTKFNRQNSRLVGIWSIWWKNLPFTEWMKTSLYFESFTEHNFNLFDVSGKTEEIYNFLKFFKMLVINKTNWLFPGFCFEFFRYSDCPRKKTKITSGIVFAAPLLFVITACQQGQMF